MAEYRQTSDPLMSLAEAVEMYCGLEGCTEVPAVKRSVLVRVDGETVPAVIAVCGWHGRWV